MRVRKDAAGLYVVYKGIMARPYDKDTPTINIFSLFSVGDVVEVTNLDSGTSHIDMSNGVKRETWSTIKGMNADIYRYSRDHFFKSKEEFNTFIKNWDIQMSILMSNTAEYAKLLVLYGNIIDAKRKFDMNQIRLKKIKSLNKE